MKSAKVQSQWYDLMSPLDKTFQAQHLCAKYLAQQSSVQTSQCHQYGHSKLLPQLLCGYFRLGEATKMQKGCNLN
jgi:hypothetical protein